jgi:hypothetical protein
MRALSVTAAILLILALALLEVVASRAASSIASADDRGLSRLAGPRSLDG